MFDSSVYEDGFIFDNRAAFLTDLNLDARARQSASHVIFHLVQYDSRLLAFRCHHTQARVQRCTLRVAAHHPITPYASSLHRVLYAGGGAKQHDDWDVRGSICDGRLFAAQYSQVAEGSSDADHSAGSRPCGDGFHGG